MLTLLACLTLSTGSDSLPNESIALEKLQAIWRAATGGSSAGPLAVSSRRLGRGVATIVFSGSDRIAYRLDDGSIYSAHFVPERDTAHLPVVIESVLLQRVGEVLNLMASNRFTPRIERGAYSEDSNRFGVSWSYVVDGYPTHRNPFVLILDARTSKPLRLHAPSFDWATDPSIRPQFTEEACYEAAWAKYMQVEPIAVAPEVRYGLRWVEALIERTPEEVAQATAPIAYWASDKYRGYVAEKRAVLAYSFGFGWQNVLVDAVTGAAISVIGADLSQSRSAGAEQASKSILERAWRLPTGSKAEGTLKLTEHEGKKPAKARLVGLVSDQLTLVGHYDPASKLLWVDHPAGAKCYEVTGELAHELAKD